MRYCDLHTHSLFSDGTFTPSQIIDAAAETGLSAVALCDHNNVDGLPEFLKAAEGKDVEAVCGCEFSVDCEGTELHILGLYIPQSSFSTVTQFTEKTNKKKEESNIRLIDSLRKAGYAIDYDDVLKLTPKGKFNRSHVAEVLLKKGYVSSVDEAFATILSEKEGHYIEPERCSVWEVIDFIKSIGAVSVFAHPFINLDETGLKEILPKMKRRGLVGMECLYSEYNAQKEKAAISIAEYYGLKFSGGSDFHGEKKPGIKLGAGKGNLRIPYEWAASLKG